MTTVDPPQEEAAQLPAPSISTTTSGSGGPNPISLSSPPTLETIYSQVSSYPFHADREFLSGLAAILGHPDTPATPEELREKSDLVLQARCFYLSRKLNIDPPIDPAQYLEWAASQARSTTSHIHTQQQQTASGTHGAAVGPDVSGDPQSTRTRAATDAQRVEEEDTVPLVTSSTEDQHAAIASSPAVSTSPNQEAEPPYPTSFAAIVDLITRNLPIPGIENIPPTVLEPGTSKVDKTPRRRKPWEKDADTATTSSSMEGEKHQATPNNAEATGSGERREEEEEEETEASGSMNGNVRPGQDQGVVKMLQPNAIAPSGLLSND
ncbi:hypothetical protein G647_03551 [Cladophialophora carrionii CBS 160.54]|uniref:Uncharacterized protein n=1 Tax=Cladophialophora carrionii CBS 160.54 TaxID=1279043 RepID=V9DDZ1_9EURO|nr:uncharacterized protein G647_03551 [Cladophialophora carrionii CBS 160.54]ETI24182.1 hypothetical protein G647_03551 [Cladophialophora carrionii CBS 160.54]